jgi:transposase
LIKCFFRNIGLYNNYTMAKPFQISIKESIKELNALQINAGELITNRLKVLIEIKNHEDRGGISKRDLSDKTGVNHNSIVKWRQMYVEFGIEKILKHGRVGFKKSVMPDDVHEKLKEKLNYPENGLRGYVELQEWVNNEFSMDIKYITILKYAERHFGTKIKVARKSHVKKDPEAGEAF